MKIKDLFRGIDYKLTNISPDYVVKGVSADSRTVKKGDIFIAIDGPEHNGYDYIEKALKKGAAAICLETPKSNDLRGISPCMGKYKIVSQRKVIMKPERAEEFSCYGRVITVNDTAKVFSVLMSRISNEPSKSLTVIGITGTNGKTTVSYLIYEILKAGGKNPSLIGTVVYKINNKPLKSLNTTPGPELLHSLMAKIRDAEGDCVVMEVSSHALKQARVFGIDFKTAILTNITGDHMDYHKTTDDYVASKRILFESLGKNRLAVLNKDDSFYSRFRRATKARVLSYGIESESDFTAIDIKSDSRGSVFLMKTPGGIVGIDTPLMGRHNIYNILAAAAACFAEGVKLNIITKTLSGPIFVPGRLEAVEAGQQFRIFIDYAHTHDALEKMLSELRLFCRGKLVVVFGCGGDRDKTKRPKMGRIASEIADEVILTSDNPRTEDPEAILDDIESGIGGNRKKCKRITDRFAAIRESMKARSKDDVLLIAGKGHENYQVIGKKTFLFSDRAAVEKILTLPLATNSVVAARKVQSQPEV